MKLHAVVLSFVFVLLLGTLPASPQTVSGTLADEQSIRDLIATHAASGRQDDVDGMVSTQHDDVDERLDDGRLLVGRDEVASFYKSIVAGGPHRLAHTHPVESIRIRFLEPDVAFVDVDSVATSGDGPRKPYFLLVTKVDGKWGVAVVRSGVPVE